MTMGKKRTREDLQTENEELRAQLEEAKEALRAISENEVDALVVSGPEGPQVFTLQGADHPYRVFIESMNEGAVTISPDGTILHCNSRFADMLAKPLESIMGTAFFDLLTHEERPRLWGMVQSCDMEGCKAEFLLATGFKNVPVQLSVRPLNTEMDMFCVVITDLTELARAEEKLQKAKEELEVRVDERTRELAESRERYRATVASIGDGVIVTDTSGTVTFMNSVAEELTGWAFDEARGKPVHEVFHIVNEFTRDEVESPVAKVLRKGAVVGLANHTVLVRKDGTEIPIDDSGAPVRSGGGAFTGVVLIFRDITERRQAEETVQTALQRFYAVLSGTYAGLLLVASDDRVEFANQAFCDLFELEESPTGLVGLTSPEIFAKIADAYLDPGKEISRVREIVERGQPVKGEEVAMRGGRQLMRDFIPIHIGGKPYGRLWHHIDATERTRMETALRESERKLSQALRVASVATWERDLKTGEVLWGDEMYRMFGEDRGSFRPTHESFLRHVHPEDRLRVDAAISDTIAKHGPYEMEYRIVTGTSEPRVILAYGEVVHDATGQPSRVIGTAMDLTARKLIEEDLRKAQADLESRVQERTVRLIQAYEALQKSEERLRLVLEATSEGFWDWNIPKGDAVFSPRYSAMLGYEPDEFVKSYASWKELVHPEDFERVNQAHAEHINQGKEFAVELRMRKKSGDWCWILSRGMVVERDAEGHAIRMVGTHLNITARKQVEQEASDARKEMLRLERLSRMGELSASLAHELNQPLMSILSNAGAASMLLEKGKLEPGELKEILRDIIHDDKRAGDIIHSLRSMVKAEEGQVEIVAMDKVLRDAVGLFNSEAIIRNIRIDTHIPDSLPLVKANKVQIQQVMINLMMNGAQAMEADPPEHKRLVISARVAEGTVRVMVRDFGSSIKPTEVKRLFEPFFTTRRSGMGLGLSLSRSIMETHGGHIWAENDPDGGASFYFDIPVAAGEDATGSV